MVSEAEVGCVGSRVPKDELWAETGFFDRSSKSPFHLGPDAAAASFADPDSIGKPTDTFSGDPANDGESAEDAGVVIVAKSKKFGRYQAKTIIPHAAIGRFRDF